MKNYIAYSELESREKVNSFVPFDGKRTDLIYATAIMKTGRTNDFDLGELEIPVFLFESEGEKYYCEAKS